MGNPEAEFDVQDVDPIPIELPDLAQPDLFTTDSSSRSRKGKGIAPGSQDAPLLWKKPPPALETQEDTEMASAEPSPGSADAPPPLLPSLALLPPSSPPRSTDQPPTSPRSLSQIDSTADADMEIDSGPQSGDELPSAMGKLNTAEGEYSFEYSFILSN